MPVTVQAFGAALSVALVVIFSSALLVVAVRLLFALVKRLLPGLFS